MHSINYRSDIDGLRAIAVMAVVLYHAYPQWLPGGFVGVDVFFVISGYLITGIIWKEIQSNTFTYLRFYQRRIRRIFPALEAMMLSVVAFGWYVLLPDEFNTLLKHVAGSAAFASNFVLWHEAGYFDKASESKPLLHLWSLAIEEQFYLIWPLILVAIGKSRRAFSITIVATVLLASFLTSVYLVLSSPEAGYYSPFSRFWELLVGALLAIMLADQRAGFSNSLISSLMVVAGLAMILFSCGILDSRYKFPGYWALPPVLGAALIIAVPPVSRFSEVVLGNRIMRNIGLISYPLYLVHWPVLVFFRMIQGQALSRTQSLIGISFSMVAAVLIFWLIEKPVRKTFNSTIPLFLALTMVLFGLLSFIAFRGNVPSRHQSAELTRIINASYDWEYPSGILGKQHSDKLDHVYSIQSSSGKNTVFIGDSNMEQYYPRIKYVIESHPEANGAILVGNQFHVCVPHYEMFFKNTKDCDKLKQGILDTVQDASVDKVVFVYSGAAYHHLSQDSHHLERFYDFMAGVKKIKTVYLVANMPDGPELDPKGMYEGSRLQELRPKLTENQAFDYNRFVGVFGAKRDEMLKTVANLGVRVIDPLQFLCPDRICPIFDAAGNPLYKDGNHMRASYARGSAHFIDQTLLPIQQN